MGEVRHLGEFGGLVPPPYCFVAVCLALLVVVCLAPLHSPYWGAATHLKYKKNLPDAVPRDAEFLPLWEDIAVGNWL